MTQAFKTFSHTRYPWLLPLFDTQRTTTDWGLLRQVSMLALKNLPVSTTTIVTPPARPAMEINCPAQTAAPSVNVPEQTQLRDSPPLNATVTPVCVGASAAI
ncbi:hypothetical protein CSKR_111077 [Clonorchis sinensis]|uniref:Uncharacterized protein n=1 Tax=Clonorchis sinensis TaxID=79923 RepID=A0A419QE48_CLOSI|nr:hypothetical protein CSKR_111077 [Clonorchis sinensis]